jgi:hypothetical protein
MEIVKFINEKIQVNSIFLLNEKSNKNFNVLDNKLEICQVKIRLFAFRFNSIH